MAHEFQEWLRLDAIPKINYVADELYKRRDRRGKTKLQKAFDLLRADLEWTRTDRQPWLLAHDSDTRHSYNDMTTQARNTRHYVDRRLADPDDPNQHFIDIHPVKNYGVMAKKTADCIQCPVEMVISQIKNERKDIAEAELGHRAGQATAQQIVDQTKEACRLCVTKQRVRDCWTHAEKALQVWSGEKDTWITIQHHGQKHCMCVDGGLTPKMLRG